MPQPAQSKCVFPSAGSLRVFPLVRFVESMLLGVTLSRHSARLQDSQQAISARQPTLSWLADCHTWVPLNFRELRLVTPYSPATRIELQMSELAAGIMWPSSPWKHTTHTVIPRIAAVKPRIAFLWRHLHDVTRFIVRTGTDTCHDFMRLAVRAIVFNTREGAWKIYVRQ